MREALGGVRAGLLVRQWLGNLLLIGLAVLWLQIPDSHWWEFLFSMLSGVALVAGFFWLYSATFMALVKSLVETPWWWRWLAVAIVLGVWWLFQMPIDWWMDHRALYAGYWTSKLPAWVRGAHTYEHLMVLQTWAGFTLRLIVTALLLPVAMAGGAHGLRDHAGWRVFRVYLRWFYWVVALVFGWVAFAATSRVLEWTPGDGLTAETLSLLLRLGFVYTLDVALWCFVLALVAMYLRPREV